MSTATAAWLAKMPSRLTCAAVIGSAPDLVVGHDHPDRPVLDHERESDEGGRAQELLARERRREPQARRQPLARLGAHRLLALERRGERAAGGRERHGDLPGRLAPAGPVPQLERLAVGCGQEDRDAVEVQHLVRTVHDEREDVVERQAVPQPEPDLVEGRQVAVGGGEPLVAFLQLRVGVLQAGVEVLHLAVVGADDDPDREQVERHDQQRAHEAGVGDVLLHPVELRVRARDRLVDADEQAARGEAAEGEDALLAELLVGPEALLVLLRDVDELLLEGPLPGRPRRGGLQHHLDVAEALLLRDVLRVELRVGVVEEGAVPVHDPGRAGLLHLEAQEPVAELLGGGRRRQRQLLGHPLDHRRRAHLDRVLADAVDGVPRDAHEDRHHEIGGEGQAEPKAVGKSLHGSASSAAAPDSSSSAAETL